MMQLGLVWWRVSRAMRRAPGYMGHFLWYRFPFTFGNFSFWDSWEHMVQFARSTEHRRAMAWLSRPRIARASFVRFLRAAPDGHSIGEWRAEPDPDEEWKRYRLPFSSGRVTDMPDWFGANGGISDDERGEE